MRRRAAPIAIALLAAASAHLASAASDLTPEVFDVRVAVEDVAQADVDEGCAGGTTDRKLLRYALRARNLGPDDLVLGDPGCPDCHDYPGAACANPLFVCSLSHGHPHFESFAQAELRDANDVVVAAGRKVSFCLIDTECAAPQFTTCGYQGITAGCADVYEAGLPCQYIDLTGVSIGPGPHTLRVHLDPDDRFAEPDESNNAVDQTVRVECPALPGAWGACALDPFLCYRTRPVTSADKFLPAASVQLTDQDGSAVFVLRTRSDLCLPTDAAGAGIVDPATHLTAYTMKPAAGSLPAPRRLNLRVVNGLGALTVDAAKAEVLLVPTAAALGGPPPLPDPNALVDRYECERVKTSGGTPRLPKGLQVVLGDAFTVPPKRFDVRKLRRLCTPVDVNGSGIGNPGASLLCYTLRPALGEPKHLGVPAVYLHNALESPAVATRKESELCLPSVVNPPSDWCADPLVVTSFPASVTQDASTATTAPDDPVLSCGTQNQKSHSVWVVLTAPGNGTVTADTAGSTYDTALAAFTGACGSLTEVACNDDYGGMTSRVVFPVTGGATYRLEITSYDALPAGSAVLSVSWAP